MASDSTADGHGNGTCDCRLWRNVHGITTRYPGKFAGAVLAHPLPKPEFILTDTDGKPYGLRAETAGKVTLLYFGYTHCPGVCPVNMAGLAAALRQLPPSTEEQIAVVFVTTACPGYPDATAQLAQSVRPKICRPNRERDPNR
jgi:hypothetical protein